MTRTTCPRNELRVACISDTHGMHREIRVPRCDLLVHAGDLTATGDHVVLVEIETGNRP